MRCHSDKTFKIPYPTHAVTPGITPTSLTTPKARQTTVHYGKVLQFASTTLAEASSSIDGHPQTSTHTLQH